MSTHLHESTTAASHVELPKVAFQGEPGAFSELAISQHWPTGAVAVPSRTFDDALAALWSGHATFAVIPVENAIAGPVHTARTALDLVSDQITHVGETRVNIQLCLMAPADATLESLRVVRSHAMALAQSRYFFAQHPWLTAQVHEDTAGAAREVALAKLSHVGAIASAAAAARYHLQILVEHVEDRPDNWTRFVVVSAR